MLYRLRAMVHHAFHRCKYGHFVGNFGEFLSSRSVDLMISWSFTPPVRGEGGNRICPCPFMVKLLSPCSILTDCRECENFILLYKTLTKCAVLGYKNKNSSVFQMHFQVLFNSMCGPLLWKRAGSSLCLCYLKEGYGSQNFYFWPLFWELSLAKCRLEYQEVFWDWWTNRKSCSVLLSVFLLFPQQKNRR